MTIDRSHLERLSIELADAGKLIEAGWIGYRLVVMHPDAPLVQLEECKLAFFAGAQHLFGSLMNILDPGDEEPTEADLRKMDLIDKELRTFAEQFALQASKPKGSA
ncbi:hypothetical protein GA0061099_103013 [Bradyrhizobium yuanmingense]|uniref:Uncharacterized protein n=1 Tax=Bradyrhizobium yuanmingense TaxID=108015 RepID=A0A1C3XJ05_9BRAD|nr:hypothetical protein [Bradyrhizobium yuanmingense]TWI17764.1 hypothetical protein IQ15_07354 [Bradyrhizobium yuanmingense]SCB52262.1 hypothetical protein GA0061099_103013 [Bradyrhizobium yuanmingense]